MTNEDILKLIGVSENEKFNLVTSDGRGYDCNPVWFRIEEDCAGHKDLFLCQAGDNPLRNGQFLTLRLLTGQQLYQKIDSKKEEFLKHRTNKELSKWIFYTSERDYSCEGCPLHLTQECPMDNEDNLDSDLCINEITKYFNEEF